MLRCWLRPTKPHTASTPSSAAASNTRSRKSCFFCRVAGVVVQQVVEVGEVRDARRRSTPPPPARAPRALRSNGCRRSSVLATGSSIASGGTSDSRRVQRRRQLDVVGAELARELQPVLDRAIGIGVAHLARRQLLQRGGQDADFHELRLQTESSSIEVIRASTRRRLRRSSRMASTMRLARIAVLERGDGRRQRRIRRARGDGAVDVAHQVAERVGPRFLVAARQVRVAARLGVEQRRILLQHLVGAIAMADPQLVLVLLPPAASTPSSRRPRARGRSCARRTPGRPRTSPLRAVVEAHQHRREILDA